jgi:hypothetical protein
VRGVSARVATAVWRISPELVVALDAQLGPPLDTYVNGTQTWLTDSGPNGETLEWRLHPVAGYRAPAGLPADEVFEAVVAQLAGTDPTSLAVGRDRRPLTSLWDGLECFAAYGEELEPAVLAHAATGALGRGPDANGLVDHERIGAAWEVSRGAVSLVALLLEDLNP